MTEITMRLPLELANSIYKFVGKSPTAKIIREHLEKKNEPCECDMCGVEISINQNSLFLNAKFGQCEVCYVQENPHFDTMIGRVCEICNVELRLYNWCKIYGASGGGEYCLECYIQLGE
jgi:hypothetical protein